MPTCLFGAVSAAVFPCCVDASRAGGILLECSRAVVDLVSDSHPYAHLRPTCQRGRHGDKGGRGCSSSLIYLN